MSKNQPRTTAAIFARNLRLMRVALDLTQKELAEQLDVTDSSLARYESEKHFVFPQPETIDKIASALGVHVCDLFTSDAAAKKKKEIGGLSFDELIYMMNKHLADAGLQLRSLKKAEKE